MPAAEINGRSAAVSGVRRVVVGVSGSPGSIRALRVAAGYARRADAPLLAAHAWLPPGGDLAERRAPSPDLRAIWKRAAIERLQDAIESAWGGLPPDVRVEHVVGRGPTGPVLLDIAGSPDDLLVVGAGRRGAVTRLWSGRVTRYCQAHAHCPVLVIPPPALPESRWNHLNAWSFRRRKLTVDQVMHKLEKRPLLPN
jgi:nucleotide-binding universal stress UspA family protein